MLIVVHGAGLAAPAHVSAVATAPGTVTVSWDPVPGATAYRILRDVDPITFQLPQITPPVFVEIGSPQVVVDATGITFVDSGLPALVRQFYAVEAVNGSLKSFPTPAQEGEVLVTAAPDAPIFGFADFHNHQFSNLGFAKNLIWGDAFSLTGSIFDALPTCEDVHGPGGTLDLIGNIRTAPPHGIAIPAIIVIPPMVFQVPNSPPLITPPIPFSTFGHFTGGTDQRSHEFEGWPRWNSITHQQVYYEWLRRAFEGGMRLMVMHALNNELLCKIASEVNGRVVENRSCRDVDNIDAQLIAAKSLETFIDQQSGGPGQGWYRIAYSGTEARHIINSGKMAIILGIEVDNLFGCSLTSSCTEDFVQTQLDHYYAMGVRHLFPVHVFDNAFGGTAMYEQLFDVGNKIIEGQFVQSRNCSAEGYTYKADGTDAIVALLQWTRPQANTFPGECNSRPLTSLGDFLIRQMIKKGMIIDIDHMGATTANGVLDVAERYRYAGVVSGHSGSTSVLQGTKLSEGAKTPGQLQRIRALGGVSGIFAGQGDRVRPRNGNGILQHSSGTVPNDCGSSSKTFAQVYLANVDAFGGPNTAAVGIGTDFNGLATMPGPRFGAESCPGDSDQVGQNNGVTYPLSIIGPGGIPAGHLPISALPDRVAKEHPFDPFENAQRKPWDINFDGLAHVGMLPDFIQDLRQDGVTDAQLQPLFRSAEGYVRMWERAETTGPVVTPPANITVAATELAGARGNASVDLHNFLLTGSAIDIVGIVTRLTPQLAGNIDVSDLTLFGVGTTTVFFRFQDPSGHIGSATATVTVTGGIGAVVKEPHTPVQALDAGGSPQLVTVEFDSILQEGFVTATVTTTFPQLPPNFVAITSVYDIVTTVLFGGQRSRCACRAPVSSPPTAAALRRRSAWTNVTTTVTSQPGCAVSSRSLSPFVVVRPKNHPPIANAGSYPPFEATSPTGASVTLVGTGADPDAGDTLSFRWAEGTRVLGSAATITVPLSLGGHDVTLTVTDNHGATAVAAAHVTVGDTKPPVVTPPAALNIPATEATGTRVAAWPALSAWLASATAVDGADPAPVGLSPQVNGAPVGGTTLFPIGTTTVTFRFRDASGNSGLAKSTVQVSVGTPQIKLALAGSGTGQNSEKFVDLSVTNQGTGIANHVTMFVTAVTTKGTGLPTVRTAMPISAGDLNPGDSRTVRVRIAVPPSVKELLVIEAGAFLNVKGQPSAFADLQSYKP